MRSRPSKSKYHLSETKSESEAITFKSNKSKSRSKTRLLSRTLSSILATLDVQIIDPNQPRLWIRPRKKELDPGGEIMNATVKQNSILIEKYHELLQTVKKGNPKGVPISFNTFDIRKTLEEEEKTKLKLKKKPEKIKDEKESAKKPCQVTKILRRGDPWPPIQSLSQKQGSQNQNQNSNQLQSQSHQHQQHNINANVHTQNHNQNQIQHQQNQNQHQTQNRMLALPPPPGFSHPQRLSPNLNSMPGPGPPPGVWSGGNSQPGPAHSNGVHVVQNRIDNPLEVEAVMQYNPGTDSNHDMIFGNVMGMHYGGYSHGMLWPQGQNSSQGGGSQQPQIHSQMPPPSMAFSHQHQHQHQHQFPPNYHCGQGHAHSNNLMSGNGNQQQICQQNSSWMVKLNCGMKDVQSPAPRPQLSALAPSFPQNGGVGPGQPGPALPSRFHYWQDVVQIDNNGKNQHRPAQMLQLHHAQDVAQSINMNNMLNSHQHQFRDGSNRVQFFTGCKHQNLQMTQQPQAYQICKGVMIPSQKQLATPRGIWGDVGVGQHTLLKAAIRCGAIESVGGKAEPCTEVLHKRRLIPTGSSESLLEETKRQMIEVRRRGMPFGVCQDMEFNALLSARATRLPSPLLGHHDQELAMASRARRTISLCHVQFPSFTTTSVRR